METVTTRHFRQSINRPGFTSNSHQSRPRPSPSYHNRPSYRSRPSHHSHPSRPSWQLWLPLYA